MTASNFPPATSAHCFEKRASILYQANNKTKYCKFDMQELVHIAHDYRQGRPRPLGQTKKHHIVRFVALKSVCSSLHHSLFADLCAGHIDNVGSCSYLIMPSSNDLKRCGGWERERELNTFRFLAISFIAFVYICRWF